MIIVTAGMWRDGRLVTLCQVRIDADLVPHVIKTDRQMAEGDYEVRRGGAVYDVTLRRGQWGPRKT